MSFARTGLRLTRTAQRTFSMSAIRSAEGSTGAPRSGGAAASDSFTKREQANEDYYVKQQEKQKLEQLKKKISDGEAQLAKDRKDMEDLNKKGSS